MAFNRELSQFASYLELDASANYIGITTAVSANVGIGSITPRQKLDVLGNAIVSGITTSTGGFVGDLTGTATSAEGLTGNPNLTVNTVNSSHINNTGVVTATGGFVGDVTGNASSATALANARTIGGVSFDGTGNINLPGVNATGNQDTSGNAATATALATGRNFTVSGDATTDSAQSFDGTGNVALPITLAASGVSAATYGSSSAVPILTVDAKGRITSATTAAVGSGLTVTGDSGSEDINLLTESLAITGGTNVTSTAASNGVELALNPEIALTSVSATGVVTATSFHTGDAGSAIQVNSATITGPSSITIDPAAIGNATGTVHILGDLQVEGTTTTIDSTTVNIADKNIQIATGAANDAAADGGGITVDSGDGDKTFQFQATGDNFGSSENMNLASGKVYKINNTEVLSATTLGSNVVNSSLTSVGTLGSLDVTGAVTGGSLAVAGAITGSHVNLTGVVTASNFVATQGTMNITGDVTGTATTATNAEGLTGTPSITVKDITGTGNINVAGVITATSFSGDGSGLTGVASTDNIQTATPANFLNTVRITGVTTVGALVGSHAALSGVTTSTGGFVGDLTGDVTGNSSTATALANARNFTVSGDATTDSAQSFDGSGNVALPITLANSGVSAATYGSASAVPVITVDAKGRITSATTTAVGSGLTVAGDTGSEDINLLSETLTISGGTNLTSNAASNAVTVNLDDNISLTSVVASGIVTASSGFVGDVTGNASSASILETARTIGGVSFNGSANINLPGVNQAGNQDTSGNAATATALANARTFTVSGDATTDSGQTFDGTGNVALPITLAASGVSAATYGSGSAVPVITVDAKGRITSATTAAVGSALTVTGDSGSEDIDLLSESLAITGGTNLTSAAASNGVELSLNPDVSLTSLVASGVVTATSFKTGAEGSAIHVNTATITGPSSITIDPAAIGNATGTVHILGDLQVEGTTTTIDSTTVTIADKNIQIATGAANDAAADGGGITVDSGDGDKTFQFEATGDNFGSSENMNLASGKVYKINNTEVLGATSLGSAVVTSSLTSVGTLGSLTVSGALVGSHAALSGVTTSSGGFVGDLTGDVTGNSSTATALQNARTIGGVSFDGTANINLPGVNQTGNQDTSGNAATATALETARTIGGVSFDGSANISLPGVNIAGNQDTSGNAATATALANARTIGGVSFDGTANIDLPGVNQSGNQDTSGTAALAQGLTGTPNVTVNAVTSAHVANSGVTTSTGGFVGNVQGNVNSTGLSTVTNLEVDGYVSIGDTTGQMNQVLASVGAGVTWKNIIDTLPQTRTTQTSTATAGQTTFSFDYNVNYLDVFVNGVKLSSSELTATNGTSVVISEALFEGDIVEFHSYATAGAGSGTVSSANDLSDVTLSSASSNDILVYNGSAFVNQQSLNLSGNIAAADLTLSGNLTVNGTQTVLNTATLDVEDLNLTLAKGSGSSANADGAGITIDGANATFNYSHTGTKFVANKSIEATSFIGDGSGLTGVASTDNIQTATEAEFLSGVKIAGVTTASGGIVGNVTGNVSGSSGSCTGNAATATALETARTIGGVSFDGTAGINLPGVNQSGNQDTSGNAATATALESARTIGGVSFNGTANINLPGVNEAGNQNTTGTAAGLSGTPNLNVGVITATSFSGDGSGLTGVASTDNISTNTVANFLSGITVAGIATATNKIVLESDDGTPGRMDFYCESSNAHYTRIQSQAHSNYSGNVTLTLPKVSGTAIVGGSNSNDTNITTSGDISAANFNSTSDITLKENVSIIDNALDMINNLEGISWNWKNNGKASLGVSAQNVETVAPELVNNSETHKSVNYNGLIGILIEAVKEQGNQITELRTELAKKANSRKKRS